MRPDETLQNLTASTPEKWMFYMTLASLLVVFFTVTSCVLALVDYHNKAELIRNAKVSQETDKGVTLDYYYVVHPLTNQTLNFTEAEKWCSKSLKSEGGHLAVVRNNNEDEILARKINYSLQFGSNDLQSCPYFLLGHRVMVSRMWRSLNGRSFLPSLYIPYQYDFREGSLDCFSFDLFTMTSTTVPCSTSMQCAICEVVKDCHDKYNGPEQSCYTLEAFSRVSSDLDSSLTTNSEMLYPLRTFNEFQQVCRRHHGGRLGAFHRKLVPKLVADEIGREIEDYNLWDVCKGKVAARAMEIAHEYETIKEEHISYWSDSLTDVPSANYCLATDGKIWKRVPCNDEGCFVCAYRVYHDPDQRDPPPNEDVPPDLNPLVWG